MRKNKFNPELLKEEIKRFKLLENYDFYHEDKSAPEYEKIIDEDDEEKDVDVDIDAQAPAPDASGEDPNAAGDAIANDLGVGGDAPTGDMPEPEAEELPIEEPVAPAPPAEDEVEIDVTSLVQASDDAKAAADRATQNSEILLQKLSDLEARLGNMSVINNKIDNLEHELVKRNPTPVEKLEMRSFDSYPYNQKLTDYWADKEGPYDVLDTEGKPKKKEYILTKDDINHEYSEPAIKKSFDVTNGDADYEEEDIY